jgi:uncharacterized protein
MKMRILGIDLAGKDENETGICILDGDKFILSTIHYDTEILKLADKLEPSLIVIDAPLSLPKGRCCLEKECICAVGGHFRQAERDIRRYGRVLPLTFKGMKMLTLRGIKISLLLKQKFDVIESHPRTTQKLLGYNDPLSCLSKFFRIPTNVTMHELDAGLLGLTGFLYLEKQCIELGDPEEGLIIVPNAKKCIEYTRS